jgi:hypothetical protein
MKIEFDQIEESFDETTNLRTITEQALVPGRGILLRTTVYSPNQLAVSTVFVPGQGTVDEAFDSLSSSFS